MTDTSQDPKQIVCTGDEGSDVWSCAFGTWSDDDFGIDSDEAIGAGERLYVRRDLYDTELKRAEDGGRKIAQLEARDYIQCGVIDKNLQSMGRQDEEIARLTAALATARNDALDEAIKACGDVGNFAKDCNQPRMAMGAFTCRDDIIALKTHRMTRKE